MAGGEARDCGGLVEGSIMGGLGARDRETVHEGASDRCPEGKDRLDA